MTEIDSAAAGIRTDEARGRRRPRSPAAGWGRRRGLHQQDEEPVEPPAGEPDTRPSGRHHEGEAVDASTTSKASRAPKMTGTGRRSGGWRPEEVVEARPGELRASWGPGRRGRAAAQQRHTAKPAVMTAPAMSSRRLVRAAARQRPASRARRPCLPDLASQYRILGSTQAETTSISRLTATTNRARRSPGPARPCSPGRRGTGRGDSPSPGQETSARSAPLRTGAGRTAGR